MSSSSLEPATSTWSLIRRFLPYLNCGRWQATFAGGLMLLSPLVAVLLLWLMKLLIDDVFVARQMSLLPTFALVYIILVALKLLGDYVLTRLESALTEQISQNVRVDLYRHIISVSPGTLRKYSVGDLLSRLADDVESINFL